jgi:hypothetical protein
LGDGKSETLRMPLGLLRSAMKSLVTIPHTRFESLSD